MGFLMSRLVQRGFPSTRDLVFCVINTKTANGPQRTLPWTLFLEFIAYPINRHQQLAVHI